MCTFCTDKIYLTWRKTPENIRHIVGVLSKVEGNFIFEYLVDNCEKAKKNGFLNYPAFENLEESYNEGVIDVFKTRLLNPARRDYEDFLSYWCANEYKEDVFALLGLTGAKLQTDSFEFIAPHVEDHAIFYTDVSWLSKMSAKATKFLKEATSQEIQDSLSFNPEPNNEHDKMAVMLKCRQEKIGYIKSIHCNNIADALAASKDVNLQVKHIVKNGVIREIILRVEIE